MRANKELRCGSTSTPTKKALEIVSNDWLKPNEIVQVVSNYGTYSFFVDFNHGSLQTHVMPHKHDFRPEFIQMSQKSGFKTSIKPLSIDQRDCQILNQTITSFKMKSKKYDNKIADHIKFNRGSRPSLISQMQDCIEKNIEKSHNQKFVNSSTSYLETIPSRNGVMWLN